VIRDHVLQLRIELRYVQGELWIDTAQVCERLHADSDSDSGGNQRKGADRTHAHTHKRSR
jgi:hypothetical protein